MAKKKTKMNFGAIASQAVATGAGAIGANILTTKVLPSSMGVIPKALIPMGLGIALPEFVKNKLVADVGQGMVATAFNTLFNDITTPAAPGVGSLAQEYGFGSLAQEYGFGGKDKAHYSQEIGVGNINDAKNSLSGMPMPEPNIWDTDLEAAQQSLAGIGNINDAKNSLSGINEEDYIAGFTGVV